MMSKQITSNGAAPGLYIVATPIGNLGDITLRALEVLKSVDLVLCEDTRTTAKLFQRFGIATPRRPYHDHNAEGVRPGILERLKEGAAIALVSDAGTPTVADPGYKLVREARAAGVPVHAVPGASAAIAALSIAGLPTDRFLFAGFPPSKSAARRRYFQDLASFRATFVFYESPRRLAASLADAADILGPREAAVARELTKLYEELRGGDLSELARHFAEQGPPKGEIVIVVAPPDERSPPNADAGLDEALKRALAASSLKQAVAEVAAATGMPRRAVYARALKLSDRKP